MSIQLSVAGSATAVIMRCMLSVENDLMKVSSKIRRPTVIDSNNSDYLVGYKNPPSHSQFKPGRSGNASGRPKKVKTVTDAFSKQARKMVNAPVKGGGSIRA